MKYGRNSLGQSLVETTFVIGIIALMTVAIVGMVTLSIRNSNAAKYTTIATKYSTEATEWLRQERDKNWKVFWDHAGSATPRTFCINSLGWDVTGNCGSTYISGTNLQRSVSLIQDGNSRVSVVVNVQWVDSRGPHTVQVNTYFTDWKLGL